MALRNAMIRLDLSILGYQESGKWLAHCLEMDIIGYGDSFSEAMQKVNELIEMQVSFAVSQGHPQTMLNPAPPKYWALFHTARERALSNYPFTGLQADADFIPTYVEAPSPNEFDLTCA